MLVFGDRVSVVDPQLLLDELGGVLNGLAEAPPGIVRHGALVGALLLTGGLAQGLADAVQARAGYDDVDATPDTAMRLLVSIAAALQVSWQSGFTTLPGIDRRDWTTLVASVLPPSIGMREPEGFAFYAVYPEAYAQAARQLGDESARVIGLRSIGTVLSASVAAALGAETPATLRPVGHPFARRIETSARLLAVLRENPDEMRLVVDEGPGASGSSFGAAADWLENAGIAPDRIAFLPSHCEPPGPMASELHRRRWRDTRRAVVTFDTLAIETPRREYRLSEWFVDLVGPAIAPLRDISGGGWRAARAIDAPCIPMFERRKFLMQTERGTWLLKFAGLGQSGERKLAMARRLHEAAFVPQPIGLRHGFMIEHWHNDAGIVARADDAFVERLGRYLAFRARNFPADGGDGASLAALCDMARYNTAERFGEVGAAQLALDPSQPEARRVRTDGRLHRWEWLLMPGGVILKADGVDHHAAHDLVGCQDIAWDVAGAIVEWDLTDGQAETLRRLVEDAAGGPVSQNRLTTLIICYSAFQLGLWSMSPDATDQAKRYERRLV